jgi:hypothetical protein
VITFQEFKKIPRLNRDVIWTEKIDGTNAAIVWSRLEPTDYDVATGWLVGKILDDTVLAIHEFPDGAYALRAQSRSKFITPGKQTDNYGFAGWVQRQGVNDLALLGPGYHYGEWWGNGINRGYGLAEKRFSLFNVSRWGNTDATNVRPSCCDVVPVLGETAGFEKDAANDILAELRIHGSRAAPGFMKPEGVIAYHTAAGQYFKVTCERDHEWKGKA